MSEQEKAQDVVARPVVGLHTLIEQFIQAANVYFIHSEVRDERHIPDSVAFLESRNALLALLAVSGRQLDNAWVVGQCRNGAPHSCANCGNTFECLTPADDARVEALNAENDRLRAELAVSGRQEAHEQEKAVTRRDKQAGTDDDPPQPAIGDTWTLQSALRARREKDARMCAAALIVYRKYKDDPDVLALWGEAVVDPEPLTIAEIADTHRRHPEWLDEQHDPVTCPYCSSPATARPTGEHADDSAHGGTAQDQALEALQFAHGAILDAISTEEGLDWTAGDTVLRMIRAALTANGQPPPDWPGQDEPVPHEPIWTAHEGTRRTDSNNPPDVLAFQIAVDGDNDMRSAWFLDHEAESRAWLISIPAAHGGTVPRPDYVELGSQIASERETWDLESYATVITIALKRAFAAGTAPASPTEQDR